MKYYNRRLNKNTLLDCLRSLDDCSVTIRKDGSFDVHWVSPLDRKDKRKFDSAAYTRLIAAGYIELCGTELDNNDYDVPCDPYPVITLRGLSLIKRYRFEADYGLWTSYTSWLRKSAKPHYPYYETVKGDYNYNITFKGQ